MRPGQHVLVIGASGGVGTFAVQIAKALGAEVTGVCGPAKTDLVRAVGADHVLDYTREDPVAGRRRYDVIIDIGGNRRLAHLRRALAPEGTLVITGGEDGGRWLGGIGRNLRAQLLSPFVSQKLTAFVARQRPADLITLRDLADSGSDHPGHRPDLPAQPGRGRRPSPGRGPRPGQGRHHYLSTGPVGTTRARSRSSSTGSHVLPAIADKPHPVLRRISRKDQQTNPGRRRDRKPRFLAPRTLIIYRSVPVPYIGH